jgi:hypothetical protein
MIKAFVLILDINNFISLKKIKFPKRFWIFGLADKILYRFPPPMGFSLVQMNA